jgi:hypothetical protein
MEQRHRIAVGVSAPKRALGVEPQMLVRIVINVGDQFGLCPGRDGIGAACGGTRTVGQCIE